MFLDSGCYGDSPAPFMVNVIIIFSECCVLANLPPGLGSLVVVSDVCCNKSQGRHTSIDLRGQGSIWILVIEISSFPLSHIN